MNKKREIINQIVFILILALIIFLLWGYGSGWLGASADISTSEESSGFVSGVTNGVKKIWQKPAFENERSWQYAL